MQICDILVAIVIVVACVVCKVRYEGTGSRVVEANIEIKRFTVTVMCSHYR